MRSFSQVFAFALGLVAAIATTPAHAWSPEGHKIICAVAWDEMRPAIREQVTTILGIAGKEQFADTCNWADAYRLSHPQTGPWHFVNVKPGATSVDIGRDCSGEGTCVLAAIEQQRAVLRDLSQGPADTAMALKFLINLIGDVHQPLDVGYATDRNGTGIPGKFFSAETNLNAVWDGGIIAHDGRSWDQIADSLEATVTPDQRAAWTRSAPLDWANESLAITRAPATGYLNHGDSFKLGADYERINLPVVLDRLKRAGVRLGHYLDENVIVDQRWDDR